MEHMVGEYLRFLERDQDRTPGTVTRYKSALRQFFAWAQAQQVGVSRETLIRYRDDLQRGDQPKRPRTIGISFTALKGFFAWYARTTGQPAPDAATIRLPAFDQAQREVPLDEEVVQMLAASLNEDAYTEGEKFFWRRTRALLAVLVLCGMRRGELLALNVRDLRTDLTPWRIEIRSGKGRKPRNFPIVPELQAELRFWLDTRETWAARNPVRQANPALWPVDARRRLCHRGLEGLWGRLMHRARLQDRRITPHGLRHWAATRMLGVNGVGAASVAVILGHTNVNTTLKYAHPVEGEMRRAAEGLAARLGEATHPTEPEPEKPSRGEAARARARADRLRRARRGEPS